MSQVNSAERKVRLVDVKHGSAEHGRRHVIYARLVGVDNGHTLISATLNYILDAIQARDYVLVGDQAQPVALVCPFDGEDHNLQPTDPCPICGDLGTFDAEESGLCVSGPFRKVTPCPL